MLWCQMVLQTVQPLAKENVPGLETMPLASQLSGATKINYLCSSPFPGCIVGGEMGLGRKLTTIATSMTLRIRSSMEGS